ncbi:uncharacterized protein LOC142652514 [Rhinoderma darwinii]|uniref:uncharacterized protein LOC142652514 n=1 Tax=Rhinoderma darwinii TaxID=43563 RepID=UPI003F673F5E
MSQDLYYRMDLNVGKMIQEVQSHPCLWDKGADGYSVRNVREDAWIDICKALYPDWTSLSRAQKRCNEEDVKKRWKSVRDRFMKEVRNAERCGGSPLKKTKVSHHDELLFSLPSRGQRPTEGNFQEPEAPATQDEQQQMEREPTPSTSTQHEAEGEEQLAEDLVATDMLLGDETPVSSPLSVSHRDAPPVATQVSHPAPPTSNSSMRGRRRTPPPGKGQAIGCGVRGHVPYPEGGRW